MLRIMTSLILALGLFHPAPHTITRCRHETVKHVFYQQCESRTGNVVTYTFTERYRVRVG